MGSKNSKHKKKNTNKNIHLKNSQINKAIKQVLNKNENNIDKEEIKYKNKEFLNIPPPIFKNIKKLDIDPYDINEGFLIYKLKEINNAFYISLLIYVEGIIIYKYYYENNTLEKINTIKINVSSMEQIIMRYFYNELDKKEYFFVEKGFDNLFIYLIKNENHYELINKNECKDFDNFSIFEYKFDYELIPNEEKLELFEIVYNQFDKNVYIISIQSFGYRTSYINIGYDSKKFNIKIFKENKFISSDLLYSQKFIKSGDLIYEDNHSKKIYILSLIEKKYIMIEIKEYISEQNIDIENYKDIENIVYSEKDIKILNDFIDKSDIGILYNDNLFCKHIFYGYNENFLYLSNNLEGTSSSEVIVIDLFKRKIIKQFILNIDIYSFENWGLQNIIISSKNSIYIFDPYTFQIITKYSNIWEKGYSIRIQTFFSKENNFYGLFINSSEIKMMYLNKINKK